MGNVSNTTNKKTLAVLITITAVLGLIAGVSSPALAAGSPSSFDDQYQQASPAGQSTPTDNTTTGGSLDHNEDGEVERDYGPDFDIPGNNFRIFYSGDPSWTPPESEDGEEDDGTNVSYDDPDMGMPRSISDIRNDGDSAAPSSLAEAGDYSYYITPSMMEFYGWTLADYRENQIEALEWTHEESWVLEPWQDDTKNEGTIEEAYIGITGINGGGEPRFDVDGSYDRFIGPEGDVLTYVDFELNSNAVPDTEIDDVVTHTWRSPDQQTQTRRTYVIENYNVSRQLAINGDDSQYTRDTHYGPGGMALQYRDYRNDEITFTPSAHIEAEVFQYNWERTRDRISDSRSTRVSASTRTSGRASTYATTTVYHGENSSGESISGTASDYCSTWESDDATTSVTRTWYELGGDRTINIDERVTIDVSGIISGTCSGTVSGTAGEGTSTTIGGWVSSDISGRVSGSDVRTFEYEYWDYWNSEDNTDEGGWVLQDKEHERTDSLDVSDSMRTLKTSENDIGVEQVALEVQENRYHNIIQLDYDNHVEGTDVSESSMDDMYYWSMMMFGNDTYIESDFRAYSRTRFANATVLVEDACTRYENGNRHRSRSVDCYDEEVPFPNQLGVYIFSQNTGPNIVSTGESSHHNPELHGWTGDLADVDTQGSHADANFSTAQPAFYHRFIVRNSPSPATSLITINGEEREIRASETRMVPYAEPDVSIDYNRTSQIATVTVIGEDGEPLDGRTVLVSGGEGDGELTTNADGELTFPVGDGINHIQVEVQGDHIDQVLEGDIPEVFYGSVTAEKTIGYAGVVGHLYDVIMQLLFAIPLLLLYLLWRDAGLGQ